MTASEMIARADALRPNHYSKAQKLDWLSTLDGQIAAEILAPHGIAVELSRPYTGEEELIAPLPYAGELYLTWLYCQIDLNNAEIQKYNQSAALFSAAWRSYADSVNRAAAVNTNSRFKL